MASRFVYSCGCANCGDIQYLCEQHQLTEADNELASTTNSSKTVDKSQILLSQIRQIAKDAHENATDHFDNHKSDWHEGMDDLACRILDIIDGTEEK